MNKEFAPYELAVKLKELGFNESCFGFYLEDGTWTPASYSREGTVYPSNTDLLPGWYTAPLYRQAFRWFDENTELKGFVCPSIKEEHFDWLIRIDWEEEIECEEAYPSRQEAELACLTKLIEIVEQKL